MKNLIRILYVVLLLSFIMCGTPQELTNEHNFSTDGKWILWNADTIAVLTTIEYAKDNGKIVKEKTFRMLDNNTKVDIKELLKYLSRNSKGWEIELNFDVE